MEKSNFNAEYLSQVTVLGNYSLHLSMFFYSAALFRMMLTYLYLAPPSLI